MKQSGFSNVNSIAPSYVVCGSADVKVVARVRGRRLPEGLDNTWRSGGTIFVFEDNDTANGCAAKMVALTFTGANQLTDTIALDFLGGTVTENGFRRDGLYSIIRSRGNLVGIGGAYNRSDADQLDASIRAALEMAQPPSG